MIGRRKPVYAGLVITAIACVVLLAQIDWMAVGEILPRVGWRGFAWICTLQIGSIVLCGAAWSVLTKQGGIVACAVARWIREGGSSVFGLVPGVGELVGGRVLKLFGTRSGDAAASTIVDLVAESISQLIFTCCGVAILLSLARTDMTSEVLMVAASTAVATAALAFAARSKRCLDLLETVLTGAGRWFGFDLAPKTLDLAGNVRRLEQSPGPLVVSIAIHFAAWFLGAGQVWVAAQAVGHEVSFGASVALLGLAYAARWAFFMVPGGLGIQEMAFLLVGRRFGIDEPTAIALSVALRVRDLALAVPALLVWMIAEIRARPPRVLPGRAVP